MFIEQIGVNTGRSGAAVKKKEHSRVVGGNVGGHSGNQKHHIKGSTHKVNYVQCLFTRNNLSVPEMEGSSLDQTRIPW